MKTKKPKRREEEGGGQRVRAQERDGKGRQSIKGIKTGDRKIKRFSVIETHLSGRF